MGRGLLGLHARAAWPSCLSMPRRRPNWSAASSRPRSHAASSWAMGWRSKPLPSSMFVWRLRDIRWIDASTAPSIAHAAGRASDFARAHVDPNTVAEIVFTSGTTGDPKGVVITHRNIVANITPVEREVDGVPALPLAVPADSIPQPVAAQSHVRPGAVDLLSAARERGDGLHDGLQP